MMDLAAERGYARLLAMREQYWQALSPEQQAQAVREGRGVYAEYGDAVPGRGWKPCCGERKAAWPAVAPAIPATSRCWG